MAAEEKTTTDRAIDGIQPISRTSLSGKIVEQIIDLISREVLVPGERLPAERELCKNFGVGRTSLREALRSLTVMGILDGQVGKGTFVCSNSNYLENTIRWGLLLDQKTVEDLIETRMMLECETASLAAQRAKAEDLREIQETLEEMSESIESPVEFLEADLKFHLLIAQATQNSLLDSLLRMTRSYLHEWIKGSLAEPTADEVAKRARLSLKQHEEILETLRKGMPGEARKAMGRHILSSSVDLRKHIEERSVEG